MGRRIAVGLLAAVALAAAALAGYAVSHARVKVVKVGPSRAELSRQYAAAKATGRSAGESDGYARGREDGVTQLHRTVHDAVMQAENDAYIAGHNAVFDSVGSPWRTSAWYVVRVEPGIATKYIITSRLIMDPANYYDVCPTSGDLCGGPWSTITAAISGGSGGGGLDTLPTTPDTAPPSLGSLEPRYPVVCLDGAVSPSGGRQGACSHHGGEL